MSICMSLWTAISGAICLASKKQLFLCLFTELSHLSPNFFSLRLRSGDMVHEQCDPQTEGKASNYFNYSFQPVDETGKKGQDD